jgi:uncharacterized membrane protein
MKPLKTRWLVGITLTVGVLYVAYLTKTALGINISQRYSAPEIFKMPLTYFHHG